MIGYRWECLKLGRVLAMGNLAKFLNAGKDIF